MLIGLSVRDIVLIDRLELTFEAGLTALTGETGTGKSILLEALGLALGGRGDAALVAPGAPGATVSAEFALEGDHPALAVLAEQGLAPEEEGRLLLRRQLTGEGRSRAFVDDQPVSVGLLRRLGDALVEVQGQFGERGLLDRAGHRALLDAYGGHGQAARRVAEAWREWRQAEELEAKARRDLESARRDADFLTHGLAELDELAPEPGEEARLDERRRLLLNAGRLIEALDGVRRDLEGEGGQEAVEAALGRAARRLERQAEGAGDRLEPLLAALERAAAEVQEAQGLLHGILAEIELDSASREAVESRYFALRELARKHGVTADELPQLREDFARRLGGLEDGEAGLTRLAGETAACRAAYCAAADKLGAKRRGGARRLDRAVTAELPPLKLEKARFRTLLEPLEEADWGPRGTDRVTFEVVTNPGQDFGAIGRIASGGELARFLLAIKVVLAAVEPAKVLIFDEVDAGVGGATAHAVGERLAALARDRQVLVITHSPQVAARADHHLRVHKETKARLPATRVSRLDPEERREEIARMLSGAEVTEEARAAAGRLIEAGAG
jgi:DNA repair protein RecN (Recombination protein N)